MSKVSVTVIKAFMDKENNAAWRMPDAVYETSEGRANTLAEKGYVTIDGEEKTTEKINQGPTEKNKEAGPTPRKKGK